MTDLELIRESVAKHAANILDAPTTASGTMPSSPSTSTSPPSCSASCWRPRASPFSVAWPEFPPAFTGTYKKGSGKPVMGFLGEFDALSSLSQQAALPEKSR